MITEIYKKTFTGKESQSDLYKIIDNYLNPQKIKNLRFVFVHKGNTGKTQKVDIFQRNGAWIRINYIGNKRMTTRAIDFDDLIKRTVLTMELPRKLSYTTTVKLTVYGNNE